jgi:hypothetical protein
MIMRLKFALLILTLALPAGIAFPQAAKKSTEANKEANKVKTIRVHIDGFQKSKSGAI